ncbi:SGNH/GDSL hydrolase family protein [Pseudomonas sp. RIT411]|uniref:SGNH/GDSL hydrolase family protein n=1 Tax=Pseudomonas sp. RIT411 TaxID=2202160 RepID=UPI000D3487BD|nr:SGNH/GDSL hydrolase family protein [Pseudomonas sp. RIT 411]RAU39242.1 SGNH/GDSL hydrolase family protein [Pseudomonas sp. RIT 411]
MQYQRRLPNAMGPVYDQMEERDRLDGLMTTGTNVLTKNLFGRLRAEPLTAATTFNGNMELEAEFLSLCLGIPNIHTDAIAGVKVSIGVLSSVPAADYQLWINPENNEWLDFTIDLPKRLGEERPSITYIDAAALASVARTDVANGRTLIIYRIEFPANSVASMPANNQYYWRGSKAPRVLRTSSQAVQGVTTKASYTNQAAYAATKGGDDYAVVPVVQYQTVARGHQVMICGDSIQEGIGGDVRCYGAMQRSVYELSTPDRPLEYFNAALHAQGPDVYSRFLADHVAVVRPTIVTYSPWSGNDVAAGTGITPAAMRRLKASLGRVFSSLQAAGLRPIVLLPEATPVNTGYRNVGANDQARRDYNATWLPRVSGGIVIKGFAAAITGGRDGTGQDQIRDGATGDNVHPNDFGHDLLKDTVKPYFQLLLDRVA